MVKKYMLKVTFPQEWEEAGAKLILAKQPEGSGLTTLAWIVETVSRGQSVTVTWKEVYGAYATFQHIQAGSELIPKEKPTRYAIHYPIKGGKTYRVDIKKGLPVFVGLPEEGYESDEGDHLPYSIRNETGHGITLGLGQKAEVLVEEGEEEVEIVRKSKPGPVWAEYVLSGSKMEITPEPAVYAWVQHELKEGTVVGNSTPVPVPFSRQRTEVTLAYEPTEGTFNEV